MEDVFAVQLDARGLAVAFSVAQDTVVITSLFKSEAWAHLHALRVQARHADLIIAGSIAEMTAGELLVTTVGNAVLAFLSATHCPECRRAVLIDSLEFSEAEPALVRPFVFLKLFASLSNVVWFNLAALAEHF